MSNSTPATSAPTQSGTFNSATDNPAVSRCCDAYARAKQAAIDSGKNSIYAAADSMKAFRKALPPLTGHQNICDFVACIAHGMLIGVIGGADGTRLLYAAQVANTTLRSQPAPPQTGAQSRNEP
jgi:hypothetical protein